MLRRYLNFFLPMESHKLEFTFPTKLNAFFLLSKECFDDEIHCENYVKIKLDSSWSLKSNAAEHMNHSNFD